MSTSNFFFSERQASGMWTYIQYDNEPRKMQWQRRSLPVFVPQNVCQERACTGVVGLLFQYDFQLTVCVREPLPLGK
jgi:hypothetical protein